jgi:hypothetical protein
MEGSGRRKRFSTSKGNDVLRDWSAVYHFSPGLLAEVLNLNPIVVVCGHLMDVVKEDQAEMNDLENAAA